MKYEDKYEQDEEYSETSYDEKREAEQRENMLLDLALTASTYWGN